MYVIGSQDWRLQPLRFTDTNPWQSGSLLLPEVFIGINADLIDLEALSMILVVDLAQLQNTGR